MNLNQTWATVLEKLKTMIPRAPFDSWVADTVPLSLDEGRLMVAVRNSYAREWLESRVADTVNTILDGMLQTQTRVMFVVEEDEQQEVQENESTAAAALEISPEEYDTAYEKIVRPDRAVYLSGYFRRWLKLLGPDLGWMYVSFRQAAYLAGARSGTQSSRFSGKQLSALSGITERTYWNRVNNPQTWKKLAGLVHPIDSGEEWVPGPTPRRLPRRYTVAMTLPLTPNDTGALRVWITRNIQKSGGAEAVLRAALDAPVEELLAQDQAQEDGPALTVRGLLAELFRNDLEEGLLESLASGLQTRLMPQNDLIVIPLFFIQQLLPHLDAGPGWMLVLLRDQCFVNKANGEVRNRVSVKGGYAEIAGWMGMSRSMTIWEWLHGREKGSYKKPVVRVYLREVEKERELGFETSERTFDVLLDEIPQGILEAALTGADLGELLAGHANFRIGFTPIAAGESADFSKAMSQFAYSVHAACRTAITPIADPGHADCTVKTTLTQRPNSKTLKPQPPQAEEPQLGQAGAGNKPYWDFDFLMSNNLVNPGSKVNLLKASRKFGRSLSQLSSGFVSWLLYAYSPSGSKISDPVGLAIKRLCETMNAGAGGDFDRLARLSPQTLKSFFDADLSGLRLTDSLNEEIYHLNFDGLLIQHKHDLYRRLFGAQAVESQDMREGKDPL